MTPVAAAQSSQTGSAAQQTTSTQSQPESQQQRPAKPPLLVTLDQLEENPAEYLNRRVTVRAEVEDVIGPRLFKIDEQNWADLDAEVLVAMQAPLAVIVNEDDRVTVTGTMRPFTSVRVDREWGWFDPDPEFEARIRERNVLVAETVTSWDNRGLVVATSVGATPQGTTGTSGTSGSSREMSPLKPVTDLAKVAASSDRSLVGHPVDLSVTVARLDKNRGFWVTSGSEELYVLTAENTLKPAAEDTLRITGSVMQMPEHMENRLEKSDKVGNEEIYVYATVVTRSGEKR